MIKAHEIQGGLALENSFNRVGLDHVILVKVATTAVVTRMMGGTAEQVVDAVSQAWVDGHSLRTYRHAPNTGSRKSWAAGDATSRGVWLGLITLAGEAGYPSALTAKTWGFLDALFRGGQLRLQRPFGSYVMENVLFKISFPAEFHGQTAVEAAIHLHPSVRDRLDQISRVTIETHESAMRIIDKSGPLNNPADRDHCIQYMTAVGLINGDLVARDYEGGGPQHAAIERLRAKVVCVEKPEYTTGYLDPERRSIANALQVFFNDGTSTERIEVEYPIGHRRRRGEGIPRLMRKFTTNLRSSFDARRAQIILDVCSDQATLEPMPVHEFVGLWTTGQVARVAGESEHLRESRRH
jgi:2-methylcitrate dehydratase